MFRLKINLDFHIYHTSFLFLGLERLVWLSANVLGTREDEGAELSVGHTGRNTQHHACRV